MKKLLVLALAIILTMCASGSLADTVIPSTTIDAVVARANVYMSNNNVAISNLRQVSAQFANQTVAQYYKGYCSLFVHDVFEDCGISATKGNASTLRERYRNAGQLHTDRNAPYGSVVLFYHESGGSEPGHIGISLGDGTYISALSSIRVTTLDALSDCSYAGWACYGADQGYRMPSIDPPAAPTGARTVKTSDTTVVLSWAPVQGATSYQVQYWSESGNTWKTDTDYKDKTATSYTSTGLDIPMCKFRICAINAGGASPWAEHVYYNPPVTGVLLNTATLNLDVGQSSKLVATISPTDALNKTVSWQSNNPAVATVDNGTVKAVAPGSATITVATQDNGFTATCAVTVQAASTTKPTLSASSVATTAGATATVDISIANNPGIAGYKFFLQFDASAFTVESVTKGAAGENLSLTHGANGSGAHQIMLSNTENVATNGVLCSVAFKTSATAQNGEYPITLSYSAADTVDQAGTEIALDVKSGKVIVGDVLVGDTNSDGAVNNKDVIRLMRSLVDLETLTARQEKAADVNRDTFVNNKDVIKLMRSLVGLETLADKGVTVLRKAGTVAATLTGARVQGKPGESVTVPITVADNAGIAGYKLFIKYDANALTLNGVQKGAAGTDYSIVDNTVSTGVYQVMLSNTRNVTANGELVQVAFTIKSDAPSGAYPIAIEYSQADTIDETGTEVALTVVDGEIVAYAPDSLVVTKKPDKTVYAVGETFDKTGMVVMAYDAAGVATDVTAACTFAPTGALQATDTAITVSYIPASGATAWTATVPITVTDKTLTELRVTAKPTKLAYYGLDTLDTTGMEVKAVYDDTTEATVTAYTIRYGDGTRVPNSLRAGDTSVTIAYTEKGATKTAILDGLTVTKIESTVHPVWDTTKTVYQSSDLPAIALTAGDTLGTIAWDAYTKPLKSGTNTYGWTFTPTEPERYANKTGTGTFAVVAVQVDRITATFAQGATVVFDKDRLDVLRPMLSIDAHYNNGDTLVIPGTDKDVQLSGKLTVGTATVTATYQGQTATFTVQVTEAPVAIEGMTIIDARDVQLGKTTRLSVEYIPSSTTMRDVVWSSENDFVATVDNTGLVTALAVGEADIWVQSTRDKDIAAYCTIRVVEAVQPVEENGLIDKVTIGKGKSLDMATLYGGAYQWTSGNTSVATVTGDGVVKGKNTGVATLTGTLGGLQSKGAMLGDVITVDVQVISKKKAVTKVKLSPKALSLDIGEAQSLTATLSPKNPDDPSLTWRTSDASVAIVDELGNVTGMGAGEATITAVASSGVKGTTQVTVTATGTPVAVAATDIAISPDVRTQTIGEVTTLDVLVTPTGAAVGAIAWTSADISVATVDQSGAVTAVALGETTITATTQTGLQATCTVRVVAEEAKAKAITLAVDFLAIGKGKSIKLNNLTGFKGTWSVNNPSVASISSKNVLKAKAGGTALLTFTVGKVTSKNAEFMGKSLMAGDSVSIRMEVVSSKKAVTKIAIKGDAFIAPGDIASFDATVSPKGATYKDVYWRSADTSVAWVDNDGTVTAVAPGTTKITATSSSGISKSMTVTVTDQIAKLWFAKSKYTIKRKGTMSFTLNYLPDGLSIPDASEFVWSSSKPSVATIDADGYLQAIKKGKTTVTAIHTATGLKAKCTVTVK